MKRKGVKKLGFRLVFILMLTCFFVFPGKSLLAETAYEGVKEKIPEFPAPQKPKDYEPDWKNYPWYPVGQPEKFDPNQPDAAEKLMWLMKDNFDSGYAFDGAAQVMDENRFGHVRNYERR